MTKKPVLWGGDIYIDFIAYLRYMPSANKPLNWSTMAVSGMSLLSQPGDVAVPGVVLSAMPSSNTPVSARSTPNADTRGCENGDLMDSFGIFLQGLLAMVAFSTLMLKRFREPKHERRPWRIWFLDTSKQAIGMLFIHFANVYLSDLTEEDPCSL